MTCTTAIVACVAVLIVIVFAVVAWRRCTAPRTETDEGFDAMSSAAYAIMDERCWLNTDVVATACMGLVRHPTESHPGACVVRDAGAAAGPCDSTNTVMFDGSKVSSLSMEDVEGRQECVLRMQPRLADADARAYVDALNAATVMRSPQYTALQGQYTTLQGQYTALQGQYTALQGQLATCNSYREGVTTQRDQCVSKLHAMQGQV